jgi:ketosteroid isomerase-like protein
MSAGGILQRSEPTTPDLVEAIRRGVEAVNRRDFDAALSLCTPDVVWEVSSVGRMVEMRPFIGGEAMQKFWEDLTGAFGDFEISDEEVQDLGSGVTFGVAALRGRPHGSGGLIESRVGVVAIWRDGRIARATNYIDLDEARAAAASAVRDRS